MASGVAFGGKCSSSVSLGLTDYPQVDNLGLRKSVRGGECILPLRGMQRGKRFVFRFRFKNNYFSEMSSGSEEGLFSRLVDFCVTQL